LMVWLLVGLVFGLRSGLLIGLRFGGRVYLHHFALRLVLWHKKFGTFQIPVDSFEETSGDARMVICIVNPEDSSPSSTNQRPCDEVYQTPRFRSPDPYPYRHARVAASRCLRENDAHRQLLSDIPHLSLPTAVGCQPPVGSAL